MADRNLYISSLCAGGMAGFVVDVVLFPLDTLKTRLQAAQGFWKSGGFKGVYTGIGPQAIGSAPQGNGLRANCKITVLIPERAKCIENCNMKSDKVEALWVPDFILPH